MCEQWIKDEHLVAESYQAGFTQDGRHIYLNIVKENAGRNLYHDINASCWQKDAFEVKDEKGHYINRNSAEKGLACYDATIPNIRDAILDSYNKYCQGENFVISEEIMIQIKEFVTQQIFRQPNSLKNTRKEFVEFISCFGNNFNSLEAEGLVQKLLLPQADDKGRLIQNIQQTPLENMIYNHIKTLNIHIEVSTKNSIISSDSPIIILAEKTYYFQIQIDKIMFPITPKILVVLSKDLFDVVPLSDDNVKTINDAIAQRALTHIISYLPISDNDFNRYLKLNKDYKQAQQLRQEAEYDIDKPIIASLQQLADLGYIKITQNIANNQRPEIIILREDKLLKRLIEYYIDAAIIMQPTISYGELITCPLIYNDSVAKQQELLNMINEYGWNESLNGMKSALIHTKE